MKQWLELKSLLLCREDVSRIARERPEYSYETLMGLYEQLCSRQMARNFYLVKQHGNQFVKQYLSGRSLLDIADWINLSPTMVARRVLELHFRVPRKNITRLLKDPASVEDLRMRDELIMCIEVDEYSGPRIDRIKTVLGMEYEQKLVDEISNLRLEFETEEDLRARGCHKTPDVLLRVPVAFCDRVVCWIDSKAKFADEYTLNKDYTDSLSSYVGRFGPGMVVYWFGFIQDCDSPVLHDSGVLAVDKFPTDLEVLPGTLLPLPNDDMRDRKEQMTITESPIFQQRRIQNSLET